MGPRNTLVYVENASKYETRAKFVPLLQKEFIEMRLCNFIYSVLALVQITECVLSMYFA